jgi:hypothetical protein
MQTITRTDWEKLKGDDKPQRRWFYWIKSCKCGCKIFEPNADDNYECQLIYTQDDLIKLLEL